MGYITIRNTGVDKLTIDNAFSRIAVVNSVTREVRSMTVDELLEYIKKSGSRSNIPHRAPKSDKKARNS